MGNLHDKPESDFGAVGRAAMAGEADAVAGEADAAVGEIKEVPAGCGLGEAWQGLMAAERALEHERHLAPRTEVICDRDHIENQRMEMIYRADMGVVEMGFKVREASGAMHDYVDWAKGFDDGADTGMKTRSGAALTRGKIAYARVGSPWGDDFTLCDAAVFSRDGVTVKIADPVTRNGGRYAISNLHNARQIVRSAMGLVQIQADDSLPAEAVETTLGEIFAEDLEIPEALGAVSTEAERDYKLARYRWMRKLPAELSADDAAAAERLERAEVFPGYSTLVERGRGQALLEEYGDDIRAIHTFHTGSAKSIYRALTQGLMSSSERYARGELREGLSTDIDFDSGGADNVFTRVATADDRAKMDETLVVFKPELFDRTDWYAYGYDMFGSTDKSDFAQRLTPDELFEELLNPELRTVANEQMFRTGIGAEYIEAIEVPENERDAMVSELVAMGLTEVGGRPIAEIVRGKAVSEAGPAQGGGSCWDTWGSAGWDGASLPNGFGGGDWSEDDGSGWGDEFYVDDYDDAYESDLAAQREAILKGEQSYSTIADLVDIAYEYDDERWPEPLLELFDAIVEHGDKDRLEEDLVDYVINGVSFQDLGELAQGAEMETVLNPDEIGLFKYILDKFDLTWEEIYRKAGRDLWDFA